MERLTQKDVKTALRGDTNILPSYVALYEHLHAYENLEEQGVLLRVGDCAGCKYEKDSEMCGVCGRDYSDAYETAESALSEQEGRE